MHHLGLRFRIAILLLLPLALLAGLTQWLLHWDMRRQVDALEQVEALSELRRGMAAVDGQAQHVSGVLRSWANWSALYEHVSRPDASFREEELNPEALAVGRIDWLGLTDAHGRVTDLVEVPRTDGALPARDDMQRYADRYQAFFASVPREPACGLTRASRELALVCLSPVRRSDGSGPFIGHVFIGRWMDPAMVALIAHQSGRDVRLEPQAASVVNVGAPLQDAMFDLERMVVTTEADRMQLEVPLINLFGERVGTLGMEWPRHAIAEASLRLAHTQRVVALLVLAAGLLLVLLLDQLVVKRLARLRAELARIMEHGHWHGSVTQRGADEIGQLAGFFNQLLEVLRRQMGELRNLSTTDALTGLSNRRAFDERLNYLLVRHARHGTHSALIVLDVDHFKRYNDALGHPAGDEALRAIARALRLTVRRQLDMPARIGGEEFGVLLEDADATSALACAEAIRTAVEALAIDHPDSPDSAPSRHLSVSCGVATFQAGDTPDALYQRADHALYASKQAGRNRVTLADPAVPRP